MPPPSVEKRAAVFTTVDQLRPDTTGHNLVLKVRTVLGFDACNAEYLPAQLA